MRERGLTLVEDDVHGWLDPDAPPTLASIAPDHTVYLASTAKALAAGLRIGWTLAPAPLVDRVLAAVRGTVWNAPPLMAEVTSRWISDGTADRIMTQKRAETRARQRLAREILGDFDIRSHDCAYHCWLLLPEPWRGEDFVTALAGRGVLLAGAEAFAVGRRNVPHAVRICLGAPRSRTELAQGLTVIREMLEGCADPCMSIV